MKHDGFDERLDGILVRAAIRLQERMRLAYTRGNLSAYLNRIGLGKLLEPSLLARGSLLELQDEAAKSIRKARLRGYLKDFLGQINMLELLEHGKEENVQKSLRNHEYKVKKKKSYLKMVEGENKRSAMSEAEKKELLKNFKVIKT